MGNKVKKEGFFSKALTTISKITDEKSPVILTGLAVAGLIVSVGLMYKSAPKIKKRIEDCKTDLKKSPEGKKQEIITNCVKDVAIEAVPTILTVGATTACIIGSNRASAKKIATLSAAYNLTKVAADKWQEEATKLLKEEGINKVKEAVTGEKIKENVENVDIDESTAEYTGNGTVLCKDEYSGRLFYSSPEAIEQAINELSYRIMSEMYVSVNDFYEILGISQTRMGDDFGWNIDDTDKGRLPITLSSALTKNKRPVLFVSYDVSLRADYRNLH